MRTKQPQTLKTLKDRYVKNRLESTSSIDRKVCFDNIE